jgi:hypothetical protein
MMNEKPGFVYILGAVFFCFFLNFFQLYVMFLKWQIPHKYVCLTKFDNISNMKVKKS